MRLSPGASGRWPRRVARLIHSSRKDSAVGTVRRYERADNTAMELQVLSALSYRLTVPTALSFLEEFIRRASLLGYLPEGPAAETVRTEAQQILLRVLRDVTWLENMPSALAAVPGFLHIVSRGRPPIFFRLFGKCELQTWSACSMLGLQVLSALSYRLTVPTALSFLEEFIRCASLLDYLPEGPAAETVRTEAQQILLRVLRDVTWLENMPSALTGLPAYRLPGPPPQPFWKV